MMPDTVPLNKVLKWMCCCHLLSRTFRLVTVGVVHFYPTPAAYRLLLLHFVSQAVGRGTRDLAEGQRSESANWPRGGMFGNLAAIFLELASRRVNHSGYKCGRGRGRGRTLRTTPKSSSGTMQIQERKLSEHALTPMVAKAFLSPRPFFYLEPGLLGSSRMRRICAHRSPVRYTVQRAAGTICLPRFLA